MSRRKSTPRLPGVVTQTRIAFSRANRLATTLGFALGALVPVVTFFLAHREWQHFRSLVTALVAGGLLFSAKTVWTWGRSSFACPWKAFGFVVLVEGTMVFSGQRWLTVIALVYLAAINGIATGVMLSRQK